MTTLSPLTSTRQLKTYHPEQQYAGMFIAGFDWVLYTTLTFRRLPRHEEEATFYLKRFANKLSRAMQFTKYDLAYYAALEDRFPGLGKTPIRRHWHALIACPDHPLLESVATQLWLDNGLCEIKRYDPEQAAAYYINKLIADGAYIADRNLDRLPYKGSSDLIEAAGCNPYVPERLREKTHGEFLVLSDTDSLSKAGAVTQ